MSIIHNLLKEHNINETTLEQAKRAFFNREKSPGNPAQYSLKSQETHDHLCSIFETILNIAAFGAKVKENAKFYISEVKTFYPQAIFAGAQTEVRIGLGLFRGYNLVMDVNDARSIKHLNDEFFTLLFGLSRLGTFHFSETEMPTKQMREKYPHLFNKKGNYYKFLRNYFLFEQYYPEYRLRLGTIRVSWNMDTPTNALLEHIIEAFGTMYQINLLLWKQDQKLTNPKSK